MEKYKHVSVAPPLTELELIIWKELIMTVEDKDVEVRHTAPVGVTY